MTDTPLTPVQQKLAEDNIALAQYLAEVTFRKMAARANKDEILSAAYHGLTTAARNFDPTTFNRSSESVADGSAFSTYARRRILGSILDWQRSQDYVPRRQRSVYKALQDLGYSEGTPLDSFFGMLDVTDSRLKVIVARVEGSPVSLDNHLPSQDESGEGSLGFQVKGRENVEGDSVAHRIAAAFTHAWESLPQDKNLIIALHYYGEMELTSVAALLDLPIDVTRRWHDEAVSVLHQAMFQEVSDF